MDLSLIKSLFSNTPSLANYMSGGAGNGILAGQRNANAALVNQILETANSARLDQVNLSAEAQKLMESGTGSDTSALTGVQKSAQAFFIKFFQDSGVDLGNLSDETLEFMQGVQDIIAGTGTVQRDAVTDSLEIKHHQGARDVFTLAGSNMRLRFAVEYDAAGKPAKMSISDMLGGSVNLADITVQKSTDGTPASIEVQREERQYTNGSLADLKLREPITLDLYAA